jgi:transposase
MAIEIAYGQQRKPDTWEPKTYTRDWRSYNKSRITEKAVFLSLLSDLTRSIDGPVQSNGRPALSLGDMVFACVYKVYSQVSSRRFSTDLKDAETKGFINEAAHYSSLNRYMEKETITPFLESLITETSAPLASLEDDFAIDSTGLGISNSVAWSRAKYHDQKMLTKKNWVKVHCCVGTKTGTITGIEITDKMGMDSRQFPSLLKQTQQNFTVREISADAAYSSRRNLSYAIMNQIEPFIPFKDSTAETSSGMWGRLYHYFQFNRVEFLKRYGKRNNVEAVFHSLKAKFGSTLKSRNREVQKNEALCKAICHNVVCLIHAMNEFGIKPEFLEGAKPL